jgi:hypothetical protein
MRKKLNGFKAWWENVINTFKIWWVSKFLISLKVSYESGLRVISLLAVVYSVLNFIINLLIFFNNKNHPGFNTTIGDLFINLVRSFVVTFLIITVIGIVYIIVGTKIDLFRLSYINIRLKLVSIIKKCLLISAILVLFVCIPTFFTLLLNIDNPDFNKAFSNLILFGIISLISLFVVIFLILCLWEILKTARSKYISPKKKVVKQKKLEEGKVTPKQIPISTSVKTTNILHSKQYFLTSIGGITWLVYILYYVGRAYTEGYFTPLGIPKDCISYQLQDYVYYGAQIDTILITIIFTLILGKLLMTWFSPPTGEIRPYNKYADIFVLGYLCLYSVGLICFGVFIQIFRPDLVIKTPIIIGILMFCILLLSLLVMVIYFDSDMFSHIRTTKVKRSIFIITAIITLLFSPYMSGLSWGAFKGQTTKLANFPKVELYSNRELIDEIPWVPVDNTTYKSNQELHLILKTNDFLFVKTTDDTSPVYMFKPSDVLSIKVLYSEKLSLTK